MNKTDKLMGIYSELGNRKTAFPKDMSFKEIYDNKLFVPAQFYDSASIKCSGVEIEDFRRTWNRKKFFFILFSSEII